MEVVQDMACVVIKLLTVARYVEEVYGRVVMVRDHLASPYDIRPFVIELLNGRTVTCDCDEFVVLTEEEEQQLWPYLGGAKALAAVKIAARYGHRPDPPEWYEAARVSILCQDGLVRVEPYRI